MTNKGKWVLFLVTWFACLMSCTQKKSIRERFEEEFDKNVLVCMEPLQEIGLDSLQARNVCECALKTAFEIDSTAFATADIERLDEISNIHWEEFTNCFKSAGLDFPVDTSFVELEDFDWK